MTNEPRPPSKLRDLLTRRNIVLILVFLIGITIMLLRRNGDDRRAPSPTPIFEGVDKIAP